MTLNRLKTAHPSLHDEPHQREVGSAFPSPFSQGMRLDDPLPLKTLSASSPELTVQKLEEDWNGYHTSDVKGNIGSP